MSVLILLLNFGSPLVALVWLIVIGDWRTIIVGIVFLLVSNFVVGLLSLPQMILGAFLVSGDQEKAKGLKVFGASMLNAITVVAYGTLAAWLLYRPHENTSPVPYALLCFTVATSIYGQKETENNPYAVIPMIANYVGALAAMTISIFTYPSMGSVFLVYCIANVLATIVNGIGASIRT
jgi:hypothetical protein